MNRQEPGEARAIYRLRQETTGGNNQGHGRQQDAGDARGEEDMIRNKRRAGRDFRTKQETQNRRETAHLAFSLLLKFNTAVVAFRCLEGDGNKASNTSNHLGGGPAAVTSQRAALCVVACALQSSKKEMW